MALLKIGDTVRTTEAEDYYVGTLIEVKQEMINVYYVDVKDFGIIKCPRSIYHATKDEELSFKLCPPNLKPAI